MSKKNSAATRDALKAQLLQMASKPDSPGSSQAAKAVSKEVEPAPAEKKAPEQPKKSKAPVAEKKKRTPKAVEGKAEKISVSLHPIDQERAEQVENALRKAGLVGRRAPTSFLLKIALAAFDEKKIDDLAAIVDEVRSQDGRGKWMKVVN